MGADHDPVQRAVVLVLAVVCALGNGAFDALVGIAVHMADLLFLSSKLVWAVVSKICWKFYKGRICAECTKRGVKIR